VDDLSSDSDTCSAQSSVGLAGPAICGAGFRPGAFHVIARGTLGSDRAIIAARSYELLPVEIGPRAGRLGAAGGIARSVSAVACLIPRGPPCIPPRGVYTEPNGSVYASPPR
jgi:hypothetical protein